MKLKTQLIAFAATGIFVLSADAWTNDNLPMGWPLKGNMHICKNHIAANLRVEQAAA
jgi:hypothetical protein